MSGMREYKSGSLMKFLYTNVPIGVAVYFLSSTWTRLTSFSFPKCQLA